MKKIFSRQIIVAASFCLCTSFAMVGNASAHCDSMDGPVIIEARSALEKRDVTPLLKWVPANSEQAIREAFARTLAERASGGAAQEAADQEFFEKLVRIHRAAEGAPFTAIKPAGQIDPIVVEADAALKKRNVDRLAKRISLQLERSIRDKFEAALHSKQYADQSIEKGREYVNNYIQYVHFVEELNAKAGTEAHAEHP